MPESQIYNVIHLIGSREELFVKSRDELVKVSYPHDSYLATEYSFNMAVTMELNPYPLLNTRQPMSSRRRIILPDNQTHIVEWLYYGKSGSASAGSSRVGDDKILTRGGGSRRANKPVVSPLVSLESGVHSLAASGHAADISGYSSRDLMVIHLLL